MSGSNLDRGAERRRLLRAIETAPEDGRETGETGPDGRPTTDGSGGTRADSRRSDSSAERRIGEYDSAAEDPDATGSVAASGGSDAATASGATAPLRSGASAGSGASSGQGAASATVERSRTETSGQSAGFVPEWRCPQCGTAYATRPDSCRCCSPSEDDDR